MMKQYVLVAGDDYERKGVDFNIFCRSRKKQETALNKSKDDLRFHMFDVKSGNYFIHEVSYSTGRQAENKSVAQTFTPVSAIHYNRSGSGRDRHYSFKDGQSGMMSITDIYAAVQNIGVNEPGTLREFSFFSHAWHGGPILVNSSDDGVYEAASGSIVAVGAGRDPDDMDPRPKDFMPPTMTASQLQRFRNAYHSDGYSWSWGCAFFRLSHEILYKLEHHRDYRSTGIVDAHSFTFTNFRSEHIFDLSNSLGIVVKDPKKVTLSMGELKRYFCLLSVASYTYHLAVGSGKKAYGGVIGTYSEYDSSSRPLMRISRDTLGHTRFYRNYLGFNLDPEGRMYGEYNPALSC